MKWFLLMVFVNNGTVHENFLGVFESEMACTQAVLKLQKEERNRDMKITYRCTLAEEDI